MRSNTAESRPMTAAKITTAREAATWLASFPELAPELALRTAVKRTTAALDRVPWFPEDAAQRRDLTEAAHVLHEHADFRSLDVGPRPDVHHDVDAAGYVTICGARVWNNAKRDADLLKYKPNYRTACTRCPNGWIVTPLVLACRWEWGAGEIGVLYYHRSGSMPARQCDDCNAAERRTAAACGELTATADDTAKPHPKSAKRPLPLDAQEHRYGADRRKRVPLEEMEILR